ncbi:MAG: Mur ligase family protein [Rhodovibrionaceae bacterium]
MKILSTSVFAGPSVFAPVPLIYLRLDLQGLEAWPSGKLGPDFVAALLQLLPGLERHGGKSGEFAARLRGAGKEKDGLPSALLLGHIAAELERLTSALELPRGVLLRGTGRQQEVFFGYEDAELALEAARLAPQLLLALLPAEARARLKESPPQDFDPAGALRAFLARVESWILDPTTKLLLRAAARRGIPWQRETPRSPRVVLGQGRHRRTIQGALNDRTPATSVLAAADKAALGALLLSLGLPVRTRRTEGGEAGEPLRRYRLLAIGGRVVSALQMEEGRVKAEVTGALHPQVRKLAEHAAGALRLEVAGLRYRATDISLPPGKAQGVFSDIQATPDLLPHAEAAPRLDLPGQLLARLFPKGGKGRIPLAAITGTNGKTTTTRMLARILEAQGLTTAVTTTDGAYVGEELLFEGDVAGRSGARAVLADLRVEAAVLETARGGLLSDGAPFDRCDVAAITNVTADHLGIDGVETLEQLAKVKQVVTDAARGRIVLNADDPLCREIAERSPAERLCYVTLQQDNPAVAAHLRAGGDAVVLGPEKRGGLIVLIEGGEATPLMAPQEIPATLQGAAWHNVQNAMFAAALARGLGVPAKTIRAALAGFQNSLEMSPGRLNIYDGHPFTVAVDYAHNPDGFQAVAEALQRRYPDKRRLAVVTTLGSRHAEQIPAAAKALAGLFDSFVFGRDETYSNSAQALRSRGFPADEIPRRCAEAFAAAGVPREKILAAENYRGALAAGLAMAESGDLLVIYTDDPKQTWDIVTEFKPGA